MLSIINVFRPLEAPKTSFILGMMKLLHYLIDRILCLQVMTVEVRIKIKNQGNHAILLRIS